MCHVNVEFLPFNVITFTVCAVVTMRIIDRKTIFPCHSHTHTEGAKEKSKRSQQTISRWAEAEPLYFQANIPPDG